jgi:hypothetical protein
MPRGFDIPVEQREAGEEAEQDRVSLIERFGECPDHHYRAKGHCPYCKEYLPRRDAGDV